MVIHPREYDLVIGTFGRSAWVLDDIRPLRELAQNGIGELGKKINLYPVPDAYLAEEIEAAGTRFIGDGMFTGENRPEGARLTYSVIKEPEEDKSDEEAEEEEEKVTIEIYDSDGNKIRTLKETPEHDGINRTIWGLEEKGVRGPSRERPNEDDEEPSGPDVLPGTYKVVMTYEDQSDSAMVDVHFDPRISYNMADLRAKQEMMHNLMDLRQTTAEATNQLLDARDMIETAESMLKSDKVEGNKEQVKTLKERSEAVKDSVNALLDYVFGEELEGQGIVRDPNPNVITRLRRPGSYIGSSIGAPSSTERILMRQAREAVDNALAKINSFFEDERPDYVNEIESADLSPFTRFETVSMD
jgi:hypothetical protein